MEEKSEQLFEVEDIVIGTRECVNDIIIILYRDNMRDTDVSYELLQAAEHTKASY